MYKGRKIAPLRGRNWKEYLHVLSQTGAASPSPPSRIHDADYVAGLEIAASGALRRGDWKITFVPEPRGPQRWEPFNIKDDPDEIKDIS